MSTWTVPLSSSPQAPSTPGSGQRSSNRFSKPLNGFAKNPLASNLSTTPAGPPPSSVGSFTPADPSPSSIFGSSQLGSGKTLFKSKGSTAGNPALRRNVNNTPSNSIDESKLARFLESNGNFSLGSSAKAPTRNAFGVPDSSPPQATASDEYEDSYGDESEAFEGERDVEGSLEQDVEGMGTDSDGRSLDLDSAISTSRNGSGVTRDSVAFDSSIMHTMPRGIKRSRGGSRIFQASPRVAKKASTSKNESAIPSIAKSMRTHLGIAEVKEKDGFIVGTENIIQQDLYGNRISGDRGPGSEADLAKASANLSSLWQSCCDEDMATNAVGKDTFKGIGPSENAAPIQKATFFGSLLLQLRHPPNARGKQALAVGRLSRPSASFRPSQTDYALSNPTAIPKVLIDWVNKTYDHYDPIHLDLQTFSPDPTAHINYWDIMLSLTLHGRLIEVIRLFKQSDFQHAKTAKDDRKDNKGYNNVQVRNIERVVNRAIQVLEHSPSLQDDNWNVTGNEWYMFRKQIRNSVQDLTTFAEGRDRDDGPDKSSFEASNFGLRRSRIDLSQSARKVESQVPWTIYQHLKTMYGILLGESTEILAMAGDWSEATVGLTIWWTGDDDEEMAVGSVALTRRSLKESKAQGTRLVDVNANAAYTRRLASAFEHVQDQNIDGNGLSVDTLNPIEVGLASIFEGNVEGVVGLLRAWSLPIASAVIEVASEGGWLDLSPGLGGLNGLDESDLMLLSGRVLTEQSMTRDSILIQYADRLSYRPTTSGAAGKLEQEGWELSICVLTRLDDEGLAAKKISELLERLPGNSDGQVDKILQACEGFGIVNEARKVADKYATNVSKNTDSYGTALVYFARAHQKKKIKDVLDLLISLSLVQSVAYPALAALDSNLYSLIFTPDRAIGQLSSVDPEAAEMLRTYMTGYATLRRFYDLRDEEVQLEEGQKPRMRPIARKNAAATALVTAITSAADNIHGGLFDESRDAVIPVDGLLTLLGEALVFTNQPSGNLLSLSQCLTILKAVEDLQTVTQRIYKQCEECFHATLAASQGRAVPGSPRTILKKTMSSMTSSHSFSMIGSSMIRSESSEIDTSKALVQSKEEPKRGWDWRKGFGEEAKGEEVLRVLRLGLAKDIAKHWMASEGA